MQKLSQRIVDTTMAPEKGKMVIRDSELKGFGLSASARSKSYFVECRFNGTKRRTTVGRADLMTLKMPESQTGSLLAEVESGVVPHLKRNEKVNSVTLIKVLEEYLAAKQYLYLVCA